MVSCEEDVINKLIKVLRFAVECNSGIDITEELDESFVFRVMKTMDEVTGNNAISNETIIDSSEFAEHGGKNDSSVPNLDVTNLQDSNETRDIAKLHKFEIIKVVVLITVISIIMLTTCRMIFQLFVRFRPEKSNP